MTNFKIIVTMKQIFTNLKDQSVLLLYSNLFMVIVVLGRYVS